MDSATLRFFVPFYFIDNIRSVEFKNCLWRSNPLFICNSSQLQLSLKILKISKLSNYIYISTAICHA